MDFIELAKENQALCIEMRRDLHRIPELGLNLPKTVAYIKKRLESFGLSYKELVNGNALVTTIEGKPGDKCLAIRADMDALPIEETGLDFRSTHPFCMHACGHDSHTAVALTLAKIFAENKDKFKGKIKLIFQPGEEFPGGAKPMIDQGALEDPKVDYIVGMHGGRIMDFDFGKIAFKKNAMMASMDKFSIRVKGKGGHGAHPEQTVDPIVIASQIVLNLQTIISRNIEAVNGALISVCKIDGGFAQNIIPENVTMEGTVRTFNENDRDLIEKRMREVVNYTAKAGGGEAFLDYQRYYPVLNNNPDFTEECKKIVEKIFPLDVIYLDKATTVAEDFAFFGQEIPASFIFLSSSKVNPDGSVYPHHNSKFDLDESQFYKAIATFLAIAFEKLS